MGKPKVENSGAAQIWVAIFQVQVGKVHRPVTRITTKVSSFDFYVAFCGNDVFAHE